MLAGLFAHDVSEKLRPAEGFFGPYVGGAALPGRR